MQKSESEVIFLTPFPFYPPLLVTGNIALVCHSMAFEAAEEQQTVRGEKIGIVTMRLSLHYRRQNLHPSEVLL